MATMFVKSDIRKVTIALEKTSYQDVYLELGKAGFIQLFRPEGRETPGMPEERFREEETRCREILCGTEAAMKALGIRSGQGGLTEKIRDSGGDLAYILKTKSSIERVLRLRTRLQDALEATVRHISHQQIVHRMGVDPGRISTIRLITMVFGHVENTDWDPPEGEDFVVAKHDSYVLGIALAEGVSAMLTFLRDYGFTDLSAETTRGAVEHLEHRREILLQRVGALDAYIQDNKDEMTGVLINMHSAYRRYEEVLGALKMSAVSSSAMFITGWMDIAEENRLYTVLQRICGDRFIAEISEQKDPDAPVRLNNFRLLKPFELLVKTMGIPANTEMDPTVLAAVTFVIMFGLMFGDVGQGLVLAGCGILVRRVAGKKGLLQEGLGQAGGILIICGVSAAACGFLYGSVFSSEHIVPALWFHPMEHIMTLFSITILIGVFIIISGLFVNIINNLIASRYTQALFEEKGLAVVVLYVAIVFFAVRYTLTGDRPAPWEAGIFIGIPLVVFCLRGVLGQVFFREPELHNITEYVIETFVEIMEMGISMLANTVSFIRVGAFALSHAGLSIVTYTLAGIADPAMKSIGAVSIIIIGNIIIIGLEGLICAIQSMRLEYYEFFSKFYKGDGVEFTPFVLKAGTSEV